VSVRSPIPTSKPSRLKAEAEQHAEEEARELRTAAERDAGEIRREAELQTAAVSLAEA
jgi:hypothetical protein